MQIKKSLFFFSENFQLFINFETYGDTTFYA